MFPVQLNLSSKNVKCAIENPSARHPMWARKVKLIAVELANTL